MNNNKVLQQADADHAKILPLTEISTPVFEQRPWGSFTVLLEKDNYKVKTLNVLAGKRLSYQKHKHRCEHWVVVEGTASVILDGREQTVCVGESVDIPAGMAHRIENRGSDELIIIEVQRGQYLGEDDIVRLQDDFGRSE